MDSREFAAKIKAKYPEYQDMPDDVLAHKMVAKFPNEYGDVTFEAKQPEPSLPGQMVNAVMPHPPQSMAGSVLNSMMPPGVEIKGGLPGLSMDSVKRTLSPLAGQAGPSAVMQNLAGALPSTEAIAEGNAAQKFPKAMAGALTGVEMLGGPEALSPAGAQLAIGADAAIGAGKLGAAKAGNKTIKLAIKGHLGKMGGKADEAADTIIKNPEISKPGFFANSVEGFTEKVVSGLQNAWKTAKEGANSIARKFGKRPVVDVKTAHRSFTKEINSLQPELLNDPQFQAEIKPIFERLDKLREFAERPPKIQRSVSGIPVGQTPRNPKLTMEKALEYKKLLTEAIEHTKDNPKLQPLGDKLMKTRDSLVRQIEATPGAAGKAAKASRETMAKQYDSAKELKRVVGASPDADPTDAATRLKVKSFLNKPENIGDKAVQEALENIEPGLGDFAKKLWAVHNDPLAAMGTKIPLLGVGGVAGMAATGWAAQNPLKALVAAALVGGVSTAAAPRTAGAVLRAGKFAGKNLIGKKAPAALAGRKALAQSAGRQFLPGLKKDKK